MGNLKQRLIKPGTDFNYAEGVKVKATEAVYADQVVYVTGSAGPFLTASRADANLAGGAEGRMMVAKHDIPADGYGVVLPWKLVKDFDTSAAGAVGDPVYLSDTPGTTRASNVTFTCPTGSRHVLIGRVTVDATAANGGCHDVGTFGTGREHRSRPCDPGHYRRGPSGRAVRHDPLAGEQRLDDALPGHCDRHQLRQRRHHCGHDGSEERYYQRDWEHHLVGYHRRYRTLRTEAARRLHFRGQGRGSALLSD